MSEIQTKDGDDTPNSGAVVVAFQPRQKVPHAQPFLSDEERIALREMIAYYREARPKFVAIMAGCPMARRLLDKPALTDD